MHAITDHSERVISQECAVFSAFRGKFHVMMCFILTDCLLKISSPFFTQPARGKDNSEAARSSYGSQRRNVNA